MASNPSFASRVQIALEARKRFVADASRGMVELSTAVQDKLTSLMNETASLRDMQIRREMWSQYQRSRSRWDDGTQRRWAEALVSPTTTAKKRVLSDSLQLVGTDVADNKVLVSRLLLETTEVLLSDMDDLRVRFKFLEGHKEFEPHDILRPEVLLLHLVEQWVTAGMPRDGWAMVHDVVQRILSVKLKAAYARANEFLISQGILPTIELDDRVTRVAHTPAPPRQSNRGDRSDSVFPESERGHVSGGYDGPPSGRQQDNRSMEGRMRWGGDRTAGQRDAPMQGGATQGGSGQGASAQDNHHSGRGHPASSYGQASEETRMMTSTTPLARARSRAQGVMGHLKRLLIGRIGPEAETTSFQPATPALAAAIAVRPRIDSRGYTDGGTMLEDFSPAGVARVATRLREQTTELKKKAETKNEKATIEIVALMFQAILQEDRIPSAMRVWFARLQMPVLRVALEEPDFFGTLNHPARQLIDRMGSCVMGFDASGIQGRALEAEIKRVVQVIEQYPETGKRVYQLVYDEFQKFLEKFLTEKDSTQKLVSVAQQVEQKETLTIQYTIEMRNMLKDIAVREEIREFLFKVWAEVLAVAAVRKGPQHPETLELKKSSTDLVWAASAKPNRSDRARVIADLPKLLQRLRSGMTLMGIPPAQQDVHLKTVSDILADAFLSKTQSIPQAQIEAMAKRLANLEDFVSEDGMGDLPLDSDSIEIMLGIDASTIDVVTDGGSKPTAAMLAWARELQIGAWFTLDHNRRVANVQFAWRSERKHLNLFASTDGHSYLIQAGRLAAYLQAGLLLPQEEETLTVRATRDALTKLEANPERLLD
jgi:hypothetical protein